MLVYFHPASQLSKDIVAVFGIAYGIYDFISYHICRFLTRFILDTFVSLQICALGQYDVGVDRKIIHIYVRAYDKFKLFKALYRFVRAGDVYRVVKPDAKPALYRIRFLAQYRVWYLHQNAVASADEFVSSVFARGVYPRHLWHFYRGVRVCYFRD